jgi:hypothetical protein
MSMKSISFFIVLFLTFEIIQAQKIERTKPIFEGKVNSMTHVPPISSLLFFEPSRTKPVKITDGRASGNIIVPYKDIPKEDDILVKKQNQSHSRKCNCKKTCSNHLEYAYKNRTVPTAYRIFIP